VIIEAGMHGVPVVSFHVGGVGDVVVHGHTGLLVAPGDLESMASSLTSIIRDADLRKRLGSAARTRCLSAFDIHVVAKCYFNLYQDLARQRLSSV
jgi:glycogen(starch) synthase